MDSERRNLVSKIMDLAAKQDRWTNEDRAEWVRVNDAYDQLSLNSMQDRLRNRLGRDGGTIERGPVNRGMFAGAEGDDMGAACRAWLAAGSAKIRVNDSDRQAAMRLGFDPSSKAIDLDLMTTSQVRNAWTTQTGAGGGFTVGSTLVGRVEMAMAAYGNMLQVGELIRTDGGEEMRWPTADDTGNEGSQVGEGATIETDDSAPFGQQTWNAYKYTSEVVKVPHELIEDSGVDIVQVVGDMLGERLGRIINRRCTVGTGASQPRGIVTAAAAGVTTTSSTAIAWDELIDLQHSVDPAYRTGATFMLHDAILKALRKLKDGEGRYLWEPALTAGTPDKIAGSPYTINQHMASSIASTNVTAIYGDLRRYKIRQVRNIRLVRLDERYADTDQVGFIAFARIDGDLLNAGGDPVKKLTQV